MLFVVVSAPDKRNLLSIKKRNLQGARHFKTLKSFLLGSHHIPHSSGRDGIKAKRLHAHCKQLVSNFFEKPFNLVFLN